MQGLIRKIPDFPSIRNQRNGEQAASTSESILPPQSESSSALQHVVLLHAVSTSQGKLTSDNNRRSPSYYGSDSTITAPPKRPSRVGDVENFQPPPASVVENVQNIATQQLEETNISPVIGEV